MYRFAFIVTHPNWMNQKFGIGEAGIGPIMPVQEAKIVVRPVVRARQVVQRGAGGAVEGSEHTRDVTQRGAFGPWLIGGTGGGALEADDHEILA
jgi:hypothetical protein